MKQRSAQKKKKYDQKTSREQLYLKQKEGKLIEHEQRISSYCWRD
jgi:hypothetical protein